MTKVQAMSDGGSDRAPQPHESAAYIGDMVAGLALMAAQIRQPMLSYLLEMAEAEARKTERRLAKSSAQQLTQKSPTASR